jgi:Ni,Fe-hydrogenase III small subunit
MVMKQLLTRLLKNPLSSRKKLNSLNNKLNLYEDVMQSSRPFRRSLAIREVDCGSDNAVEMELSTLCGPCYDIEQYGISFVASPRHADALIVTGAVTHAMVDSLKNTYEATPNPKIVIAVGDDACNGGLFKGTYAVIGGVDTVIPVDYSLPGNPPSPDEILGFLLAIMNHPNRRVGINEGK